MTPPDAATTARPARQGRAGTRRRAASRPPRRVSGPARGVRATRTALPVPAGAAPGSVAVTPPLARLARAARRVGDARLLDRLVRGRGWIALVAVGLMGIVFVQVSMLRLNAGISRAVTAAETLERQNSILRADISKLDAGERIADTAAAEGMIRPPAGGVNYLDARKASGVAAARAIKPPQPVEIEAPAPQAQAASVAPAQSTAPEPAAAQQAAQTQTAPAQTVPAQTVPQQTVPQETVPQQAVPTQTAAPAQTQTQAPVQTQAPAAITPGTP
jgi:hypothetical protein